MVNYDLNKLNCAVVDCFVEVGTRYICSGVEQHPLTHSGHNGGIFFISSRLGKIDFCALLSPLSLQRAEELAAELLTFMPLTCEEC